jgi:hypothetical protein
MQLPPAGATPIQQLEHILAVHVEEPDEAIAVLGVVHLAKGIQTSLTWGCLRALKQMLQEAQRGPL